MQELLIQNELLYVTTCVLLLQSSGAITVLHTELLPGDVKDFKGSATLLEAEEKGAFRPVYRGASNAFCIRLFWIDEKYETR